MRSSRLLKSGPQRSHSPPGETALRRAELPIFSVIAMEPLLMSRMFNTLSETSARSFPFFGSNATGP